MKKNTHPSHPGTLIAEDLAGVHQGEVARMLGTTRQTVNRLYQGHQSITVDMAIRLESITGRSAEEWMHLQAKHDLSKWRAKGSRPGEFSPRARQAEKQASRQRDIEDIRSGVSPGEVQARNAAFDAANAQVQRPKSFRW